MDKNKIFRSAREAEEKMYMAYGQLLLHYDDPDAFEDDMLEALLTCNLRKIRHNLLEIIEEIKNE